MKCKKCGTEIPENAIRCANCGIKVNMYCPECNTLNSFGTKRCVKCNYELIKKCSECGSSNMYYAAVCRKCKTPLTSVNTSEQEKKVNLTVDKNIVGAGVNVNSDKKKKTAKKFTVQTSESSVNGNMKIEKDFDLVSVVHEDVLSSDVKDEVQSDKISSDEIQNEVNEKVDIITANAQEESAEVDIGNNEENSNVDERKKDFVSYVAEVQKNSVKQIINLVKNSLDKKIIGVNGNEESGKSLVLRQAENRLAADGYMILKGSCTPLLQITSFGFFQDAFLRMLGFPPYTNDSQLFKSDFINSSYGKKFSFLDENELDLFLNILYPSQTDKFGNILNNKNIIISVLEKIIKAFLTDNNLVIVADNFELLDGASYDFIVYMIKNGFFNSRLKLIAGYSDNKQIQNYFEINGSEESIFETIFLEKYGKEDLITSVSYSLGFPLQEVFPESYIDELIENSNGNASVMEQETALLFDSGYITVKGDDVVINSELRPERRKYTLEELVKLRIKSLSPGAQNILFMAAITGYRFSPSVLCVSSDIRQEKAEQIVGFLTQELFIHQVDNYTCEFKNLNLWKIVYSEAKSDLLYKENSQRIYSNLKSLTLSSNLQKVISCSEALTKEEAYQIWKNTAQLCTKSGDTNLYIISKKQMLKLAEEINIENSDYVKSEIYEEIGKLLYQKSPSESIAYLSGVLDEEIKKGNAAKAVDIAGYFINSCYLTGNYNGVNEAVDSILTLLDSCGDSVSELDISMIKTRKLKALFNMGNCEQISVLINDEILPVLDGFAEPGKKSPTYSRLAVSAFLNSKIYLAKCLALQGNSDVFEVISEIRELIEKYQVNREVYTVQTDIAEAFAETVWGNINASADILNAISEAYKNKSLSPDVLAQWNIINVLNRLFAGQTKDLKTDLFELASFTNNINEPFIKNLSKLILSFVINEEGNRVKALEILNEEITYFAKEKSATGALASWLLIARISAASGENDKAINTASKALEIAQSPKINNFVFAIYFEKLLSELYLTSGDTESSKMYLEKALYTAQEQELKYQLAELYVNYAQYMRAILDDKQLKELQNVKMIYELYNKATDIADELQLQSLIDYTSKEHNSFKTFCQLNSIVF